MKRAIVSRSLSKDGWDVICPMCRTNDWYPTARFSNWANAINFAIHHANTHRSHP